MSVQFCDAFVLARSLRTDGPPSSVRMQLSLPASAAESTDVSSGRPRSPDSSFEPVPFPISYVVVYSVRATMSQRTRRTFMGGVAGSAALVAGCIGDSGTEKGGGTATKTPSGADGDQELPRRFESRLLAKSQLPATRSGYPSWERRTRSQVDRENMAYEEAKARFVVPNPDEEDSEWRNLLNRILIYGEAETAKAAFDNENTRYRRNTSVDVEELRLAEQSLLATLNDDQTRRILVRTGKVVSLLAETAFNEGAREILLTAAETQAEENL